MGQLKVYNGSSWDTVIAKLWSGSVWYPHMHFYDGADFVTLYPLPGGPTVQLPAVALANVDSGTTYSGIKIDSNSSIYRHISGSVWTDTGQDWLLNGLNSEVWVHASYSGDTLYSSSAVGSRLACTSDHYWRVRDTTDNGIEVAGTLTLQLWDHATVGNLLATRVYPLDAEWI